MTVRRRDQFRFDCALLLLISYKVMEKEVYLVEYLGASRNHEPMHHLKASVLCRPTIENTNTICKELKNPRWDLETVNGFNDAALHVCTCVYTN